MATKSIQREKTGTWAFTCPQCKTAEGGYASRAKARDAYGEHKEQDCVGVIEEKAAEKKKAPAAVAPAKGYFWRLATVTSPKTGRTITVELTKEGRIYPSDQEWTGLKKVDKWWEVRAKTRKEARALIAAGKAEKKVRK